MSKAQTITAEQRQVLEFKVALIKAHANIDIDMFGGLLGYTSQQVADIVSGKVKEKENGLLVQWHNFDMLVKSFNRVNSQLLANAIKVYS